MVLFSLITSCESNQISLQSNQLTAFVDPFIGTGGHGHTYPGATVPFGMLQVSPTNGISKWDWCSGYHYSDSIMVGFTHLNLSGTGIGDLKDILLMPVSKPVDLTKVIQSRDDLEYKSSYSHDNEVANPGYYSVFLEDAKTHVEITTSNRVANHRYHFSKASMQSVVLDLGFATNWDTTEASSIHIENDSTVSGYRYSKGWANNQKVFFSLVFSKPMTSFDLVGDQEPINSNISDHKSSSAQFFFDTTTHNLNVKIALSSVSVENAKLNLNSDSSNFDQQRHKANHDWEHALSKIQIQTDNEALKKNFYTALYHSQLAPVIFSDINKQFRFENDTLGTASGDQYSTLSLWDTFRTQQPLLTLIKPEIIPEIINSMLLYYDQSGILPVWTLYGNETNTMTGYHSIPVIVEAYKKGIKTFDAEKAYKAMKATMMQDERGLEHYKVFGYIPYTHLDESVTITLEYAYNDWCVAQMAKALGYSEDYNFFLKRSEAYTYLFDAETGFMRGKSADGKSWHLPFDPKHSNHRKHTDYTEGNAWQHSWFVPHNVSNFIELHGGNKTFNSRLEQLFYESSEITGDNVSVDISGLIGQYAHGNEPSHHIAYLFNAAKAPWRTQYWVNEILKTQYAPTPDGLSGNEDCGQMSAWYVMASMGLYPVNPASGNYEISSPLFSEITLQIDEDTTFRITTDNLSEDNIYIQSVTLNGQDIRSTQISHKAIISGGHLHFVMGPAPHKSWFN